MIEPYAPERRDELAAEALHDDRLTTTDQTILAEFEDADEEEVF